MSLTDETVFITLVGEATVAAVIAAVDSETSEVVSCVKIDEVIFCEKLTM